MTKTEIKTLNDEKMLKLICGIDWHLLIGNDDEQDEAAHQWLKSLIRDIPLEDVEEAARQDSITAEQRYRGLQAFLDGLK
jgi:hypothetical protein